MREEFHADRIKVHAEFDGESYDGSVVNMGLRSLDGSICYIIGIRKDIRQKIGKQSGDTVHVVIQPRLEEVSPKGQKRWMNILPHIRKKCNPG